LRQRLLDQLPLAVVVEDDGPRPPSPWRGYQLCLDAIPPDVTHALIIQDDTVVCVNFTKAVEVIAAQTQVPVCLFVSGAKTKTLKQYRQAVRSGVRYAKVWFQDYCPVVATLWPLAKVTEFLEWYATDPKLPGVRKPYRSDDAVVGSWMKFTRQTVLATVPSLVEHPDDTLSVKWNESRVPSGTGNKARTAFQYIAEGDPLSLDWSL
jgi:hypothetical protein